MNYEELIIKIFDMFLSDNVDFGGEKSEKALNSVKQVVSDLNKYIEIEADISAGFVEQSQNAFIFGFHLASLLHGDMKRIKMPGANYGMEAEL